MKIDFILLTVSLSDWLNDDIHKNTLRIQDISYWDIST